MSRDSRKSKTYKAEQEFWNRPENDLGIVTQVEAMDLVQLLLGKIDETGQGSVTCKFGAPTGSSTAWCVDKGAGASSLEFSQEQPKKWIVLHELAHAIQNINVWDLGANNMRGIENNHLLAGHGPAFLNNYIRVVKEYDADLGARFESYWLNYCNRKVCTEQEEIELAIKALDKKARQKLHRNLTHINRFTGKWFTGKTLTIKYSDGSGTNQWAEVGHGYRFTHQLTNLEWDIKGDDIYIKTEMTDDDGDTINDVIQINWDKVHHIAFQNGNAYSVAYTELGND